MCSSLKVIGTCHLRCYCGIEIFSEKKTEEDPHNVRARGELRKLKKLADLANGKQE